MTLQTDASFGIGIESTWGTPVTVSRWWEYTDQNLTQNTKFAWGQGLRVGKVIPRTARRVPGEIDVKGDLKMETCTAGQGLWWKACLGNSTSTLISGSAYQQLHTPATTDPMPFFTAQAGMPPIGGGATIAHTYTSCMIDKWSIMMDSASGIVTTSSSWVGKELLTATAYAAPSYSASAGLFTFQQGSLQIGIVGTSVLTVPTTTALATMTSPNTPLNVTKFQLDGQNNLDNGGRVFGSNGKRGRAPVLGLRQFSGQLTAEFTDVTWRDYFLNQNPLIGLLTLTSPLTAGGTPLKLQIVIPNMVLEGDVPNSNMGKLVDTPIKFTVGDGELNASPLYIAQVTADTAL